MSVAIRTDDLCKEFKIGATGNRPATLSERFGRALRSPAQRIRRMLRGDASAASGLTEIFRALEGVSFEVPEGEVLGLIGRNGAGKTTLLRILSRITEPTRGSALVRGRVGSLLEVGTGFHPELTGRENIYLNGAILGMRRREIDAHFDEIVAFAGVERFLETPVKHYSSGMYLRLAFAVAAHLDAEILLVDEVLAVGDAEFQRKCLSKMHDVSQSGRTVLFVSHNMAAVENLCSRAIWLDGGRVAGVGHPTEVIPAYLSSYATGGSGMDLRSYEPRTGTGEIRFESIEFLTGEGATTELVRSGERLRIRVSFEVLQRVLDPHIGIKFFSGMGTEVTSPNTWQMGYSLSVLEPGRVAIDLVVDSLYLSPDRYYLSLWTSSIDGVVYDELDRCCTLDVEDADYYGSGRGVGRKGLVFLPCSWSLATGGSPAAQVRALGSSLSAVPEEA